MGSRIDDPRYWRAHAEEARAVADQLTHSESKKVMLEIALGYLSLARLAEQKQADKRLKRPRE
jgi:hypothetical protein